MFKQLLAAEFAPYGGLSEIQLDQLERHYTALTKWNERLNLTRIRGLLETVQFHYCESLFLARFLPLGQYSVVDIGSGAGFPGIPTAILRPDLDVTLVESHQRKSVFLRESARDLPNVRVLPSRAEDVGQGFEWAISRAVSPKDVIGFHLAANVALLIGTEDAQNLSGTGTLVPWGKQRVLFHVKQENETTR